MSDNDPAQPEKMTSSCGCKPGTCCQSTPVTEQISGTRCIDETPSRESDGSCYIPENEVSRGIQNQGAPDVATHPVITPVSGTLTASDTRGHILARLDRTGRDTV